MHTEKQNYPKNDANKIIFYGWELSLSEFQTDFKLPGQSWIFLSIANQTRLNTYPTSRKLYPFCKKKLSNWAAILSY